MKFPRPVELGGGWRLMMLEDGEEVSGVFPIVLDDPQAGVTWWNGCREPERGHWLAVAKSAVPADAWAAYPPTAQLPHHGPPAQINARHAPLQ
jgi:hypothetical protein